ncbi:ABC transporter permease [Parvularcula oceani]|uniref:ABC transporter permease n=1 Tax=Parvularcula oceani TaxID=1247963 RepID=UPI00138DD7C9|nr:ABC transporter permease [Parvularcula oceani]
MREGAVRWRLWSSLAWEDLRQRYRRSFIGLLWSTISFAFFIAVKVLIFNPLIDAGENYFTLYVALGFFAWTFISAIVTDGCNVYVVSEAWVKGARLPLTVFVMQMVARNCVIACYNLIVIVALMVWLRWPISWMTLAFVPVFFLFCLNGVWVGFVLGAISARHRDFLHLVQTIMRVMFFLTPIFWLPNQMGGLWEYLQYNPFAHYIILLRDPVLEGSFPVASALVVGAVTVVGSLLAVATMAMTRKRIVFWL